MRSGSSRVELLAVLLVLVVLGILFVLMLAADMGVWAWSVAVAALLAAGGIAVALVARRRRHPPTLDAPPTGAGAPASPNDAYRVLVVADDSLTERAFRERIAPHAAGRPIEALVIAPALRSRLAHWTGDDSEQAQAEAHLAETRDALEAAGVPVRAEIGSDDPIQAADDGLRTFAAEEVVFVTGGDANWLEQGVVDVARGRYDLRVTHVETGPAGP